MTDLPALLSQARALVAPITRQTVIADIQAAYYSRVYEAVHGYLKSTGAVTAYRNDMGQAVIEAFSQAYYAGYVDAGGEEVSQEDEARLTELTNAELENVKSLFASLRELRATGDYKAAEVAEAKATGYSATLLAVYGEAKMRGDRNVMLTFRGKAGKVAPCRTCAKWNGKRHSASYWLKRGLVGRNGNPEFECGRWDGGCSHHYYRDSGELYAE